MLTSQKRKKKKKMLKNAFLNFNLHSGHKKMLNTFASLNIILQWLYKNA